MLPPLATTQDVEAFLIESVRAPIFNTEVVGQISRARKDQVLRKLMVLQSKRVKVTIVRCGLGSSKTSFSVLIYIVTAACNATSK